MKSPLTFREGESGVTLIELLIIIVVLSIMAGIAIPAFSNWLPDYRLRAAAQELYADMHLTKMMAIKENKSYRLVFTSGDDDFYIIERPDGSVEKTINLNNHDTSYDIGFGCGNAKKAAIYKKLSDYLGWKYHTGKIKTVEEGEKILQFIKNL